ncbi:nucleoid occlusion protein [Thermoanaerobacterium sp. DL9XJH110]|uniref:nucleoid occlusion protein n=1 Tax=Thermoanaerobacterium sp. DL9XJH110 TaxID=3386643 RepID=UPI003BB7374C
MWGDKRTNIVNIPVDAIKPNPYQPRKEFADEAMDELTNSIKVYGVLQPIVVRKSGKGYELIAGERRWRACQRAGLKEIPAIIKEAKDSETAIMALIENLQRENLSFLEEAEGYRQLMQEYGMTQEQLALKLGKSQSTIANKMRILKMQPGILKIISQEKLTERHARCLLKLPDEKLQMEVLKQVIEKGLNVRQTEDLVEKTLEKIQKPSGNRKKKSFKMAIKDVRIFVNSVKKLVKSIKETGLDAGYKEIDKGDFIELVVQIPKR